MAKVLVIAAHPDDEVLGCGGTMARHVSAGDRVSILILGEGLTSRQAKRDTETLSQDLSDLQTCARAAAKVLGVSDIFFESLPDNRFDSLDLLQVVKKVEAIKEKVDPDIVYTHHSGDLNVDHRITHHAVITAFRPIPGETLKALYAFEVLSSTEWQTPDKSAMYFMPNHFVDITPHVKTKLAALACYEKELRAYPHPRSMESVDVASRAAGTQVGVCAAERFVTLRSIWN